MYIMDFFLPDFPGHPKNFCSPDFQVESLTYYTYLLRELDIS